MVALSTSRARGKLAPTMFRWAPGATHERSMTGSVEVVAVTTRSAPRIACAALGIGSISQATWLCISSARVRARSMFRLATRTRRRVRTAAMARRCVRACTPAPMMAKSPASPRASKRVARPETAAVRMAVMAEAFISASSSPVVPSNNSTLPWCMSLPRAELSANKHTTFSP